jgi:preprotein translocase subunit SecG
MNIIFSWNALWYLLMLLYVPSCIGLILIVLLQKGKGMGLAGAFGGGGGAETVFGPRTSRSLPQRITYIMAGLFMSMAIIMSLLSGRVNRGAAPELITEDQAAAMQSEQLDELFEESGTVTSEDGTTTTTPVQITPTIDGNAVVIDPSGQMTEEAAQSLVQGATEAPATEEAPAAEAPAEAPEADEAAPAVEAPAEETPAPAAEAPAAEETPAPESAEQPQ